MSDSVWPRLEPRRAPTDQQDDDWFEDIRSYDGELVPNEGRLFQTTADLRWWHQRAADRSVFLSSLGRLYNMLLKLHHEMIV